MKEIFSNRIEITNPRIPLDDVNRFIDTTPKSRNESRLPLKGALVVCLFRFRLDIKNIVYKGQDQG